MNMTKTGRHNGAMSKLLNQVFAQVDGVVWDLMSNTTGIRRDGGIYTLASDDSIEFNPLDAMSMAIPAFSQLTPTDQVKRGDVLMNGNKPSGWITEVKTSKDKPISLKALSFQGHETVFRPKAVKMLGMNGVTVVRSPLNFSATQGGKEATGFDMTSLLPLMLLGDKGGSGIDGKTIALMSLMGSGGLGGMNPMMLALLMGDGGDFLSR
jgi:hypothetical protein